MSEKVPSRHNRRQKSRSTGRVHVSSEKDQRNRNASNTQEGVPVHMQGFYKECILTLLGCIDTALRLRKMIIVPYDCLRTNMREFPVSYFKEFIGERAEDAHRGDFFMNLLFEHKSLGIRIRPYGFGGISLSSVKWGFTLPAGLESILGQLNNLVLEDIRCVVNGQIQQQQQQQAEERQSDASKADQGLLSILTHGSPRKSSMAEQKTETPRREGGFDTLVKSLLKPCTSPKASNSQTTTTSGRNATSPRHQTRSEDDENRDRQLYKECLTLLVPIIAQHIERGTKDVDYELSPYSEMRAALSPGVVRDHSSFNRLLRGGGSLPRIDVYLNDGLRYREVGLQIIVVEDSLYTSNLYDIRWRLRLSEEKSLVVSKLIPDASEQVSDDTREGKDEEDVEDVEDLEDAKEQVFVYSTCVLYLCIICAFCLSRRSKTASWSLYEAFHQANCMRRSAMGTSVSKTSCSCSCAISTVTSKGLCRFYAPTTGYEQSRHRS